MNEGTRKHESATLKVAIPTSVPLKLRDGMRELIAVHTPDEDRRKGYASKLLKAVVEEADLAGIVLMLTVRDDGDMNSQQLMAWYTKYGFKAIQMHPVIMARQPRTVQARIQRMARRNLSRSIAQSLH